MTAFIIFISTFGVVVALGLQSLNVNGGHKLAASITSLIIGSCNLALLKIMPQRKAMEMAILGKNYSAKEAFDLGIVTHLSTKENIEQDTKGFINSVLENSPFAIKKGFEAMNNFQNLPENEQHHYLLGILHEIRDSEDAKEGILAFKEKRKK